MATVQAEDLLDLAKAQQNELHRHSLTIIAPRLNKYPFVRRLFKKNKVTFSGAPQIQWDVMLDHSNQAENFGLYQRNPNGDVQDQLAVAQLPWRGTRARWYYESIEMDQNRDNKNQIQKLLNVRRYDALIAHAEKMETNGLSVPSSTSDNLTPSGIPVFLPWTDNSSTNPNGGFDGTVNSSISGATTVANINPSTQTRWKSWAFKYANITKDDLVRKLAKGSRETDWEPPIEIPEEFKGSELFIGTTGDNVDQLQFMLENQNQNLGTDIAKYDGQAVFKRTPITWWPKLDAANKPTGVPTGAIYCINFGLMHTFCLKGWFMKKMGPRVAPNQITVIENYILTVYNTICYDRRRAGFVGATGS